MMIDTPYPRGHLARMIGCCAWASAVLLLLVGCQPIEPASEQFQAVIGSRGHSSGKFNRPRGIVHDSERAVIYVVDWDGRIQKFTDTGDFRASWIMPEVAKGKPEDLCLASDGTLLVTDTHYSRVAVFSPNGDWLRSWGRYGTGPGEFIYPVGICCDPDGNVYVAEYGENDRIQKFSLDGQLLTMWGSFGAEPGKFQRPAGMAWSPAGELIVADACNHRLQFFSPDGELIRMVGTFGDAPGQFKYPYDVAVLDDALYVLEYGNQRVQKLTLKGDAQATFGRPGRGDGCFFGPWRLAAASTALFVSDTNNNRVVKIAF